MVAKLLAKNEQKSVYFSSFLGIEILTRLSINSGQGMLMALKNGMLDKKVMMMLSFRLRYHLF